METYNQTTFYEKVNTLPLVHELIAQAVQRYEKTKQEYPTFERAVSTVENGVHQFAEKAKPTYDEYLQNKVAVANKTACETLTYLEKNYPQIKITPNELRELSNRYYDQSLLQWTINAAYSTKTHAVDAAETTKKISLNAIGNAKTAAIKTTNLGVGTVVVSTQLSVAGAIAVVNLGIYAFIASKNAGINALRAINHTEKVVRDAFVNALLNGKTTATELSSKALDALKSPKEKVMDNANAFLDMVDTLVDRFIVDGEEAKSGDIDHSNSSIPTRLSQIGSKVATGLTTKAQRQVFNPMRKSIERTVDELQNALVIFEYAKKSQNWAKQRAIEGYDRLNGSLRSLLETIEQQATELKMQPETLLLRTIRVSSSTLSLAASQLVERSNGFLPNPYRSQLKSAVDYIKQLDRAFVEAENLYDVRDEIVAEAKERLNAFEVSLVGAVDKLAGYPPISWMAIGSDDENLWDFSGVQHIFDDIFHFQLPTTTIRQPENSQQG